MCVGTASLPTVRLAGLALRPGEMAKVTADRQAVEAEVLGLGDLDLPTLRERWRSLFGNPAPKSLRRAFLAKACAYQIQVNAFGGLSPATKRHLRAVAEAARTGGDVLAAPRIKPGTQLLRSWQGQ